MRRICLMGAAIAGSLICAVAVASAATKSTALKPTTVKCKLVMSVAVPDGDPQIALPVSNGDMYGRASCGKVLGHGLVDYSFTLQDTGDLTGTFTEYFAAGSVHGKFDLTPGTSMPPTPSTFLAQAYTGTAKVTGGTGVDATVTGKAKLTCATPDSVHMSCTEKAKLKL